MPRTVHEVVWTQLPEQVRTPRARTFRGRTAVEWHSLLMERPGEWAFLPVKSVGYEVGKELRALGVSIKVVPEGEGAGVYLSMPAL